jgi:hypothetical protein
MHESALSNGGRGSAEPRLALGFPEELESIAPDRVPARIGQP